MKLGMVVLDDRPTVIARVDDDHAVALDFPWMIDLIEAGEAGLDAAALAIDQAKAGSRALVALAGVDWLPPNPRPSKILGCALNSKPISQFAYKPMTAPMFFMKGASALTAHTKTIDIMPDHGAVIPEPEPAAIFGRRARGVPPEEILDYIFGWTITNDVAGSGVKFGEDSVALRQEFAQVRAHQTAWLPPFADGHYMPFTYHSKSKASDTFAPMGPWLTTSDEIADPNAFRIRGLIDGECYTDNAISNYLFPVERVLSEATKWFTMEPGDCVHTGTVSGGTPAFPKGNSGVLYNSYDGKVTEIEIEGLGTLANVIRLL